MLANACCCEPTCVILKDDFNRGNNTNLGGEWVEVSGNPGIVSNELNGTGAYLVVTTKSHDSERMVVQATLIHSNSSIGTESLSIVLNYLDSNNYLYVRYDFVYGGIAMPIRTDMRFFRRAGGVDSQLGATRTLDAANVVLNFAARACYDGTYLKSMGQQEAATMHVGGFKAGMRYHGTLTARFDDFKWYKNKPNCPNCIAQAVCLRCQGLPQDAFIDLGVGGLTAGFCAGCATVAGEYSVTNSPLNQCYWRYDGVVCVVGVCTVDVSLTLELLSTPLNASLFWNLVVLIIGRMVCGAPISHTTVYQSATFQEPACATTPVTLNRGTTSANGACVGTLPATAELRLS